MTTIIPNSQAPGAEVYEDMFKEITRKLYGEEATHSLHTPAAHLAAGSTAASDVDRSFSSLVRLIYLICLRPKLYLKHYIFYFTHS